ncbi:MAG: SMI1/KNR4 family protein, partial [Planctomycetota bacterium]
MLMNAKELIDNIRATPDCLVLPPAGLPEINPEHVLPPDAADLYSLCGGLVLFESIAFPVTVLPPARVKLANRQIALLQDATDSDDISWSWYTIADDGNGDYFTVDCAPQRLGRCYNSFHETHGIAGQTPIV